MVKLELSNKKEHLFYSIIMSLERDVYTEKRKGKDVIVNQIDYECDLPAERESFEMHEVTEDHFKDELDNEIKIDEVYSRESSIHHVKIIMQINQAQFENLLEEFDLSYECPTGGAISTPAFFNVLSPADSFVNNSTEIDGLRVDAYVTPYKIQNGCPFLDEETWKKAHDVLKSIK